MKRGWKIFFIILAIIIIAIGIYAYHTYRIVKEVQKIQTDYGPSFKDNLKTVMTGDCSQKEELEANAEKIEKAIENACGNFVIKAFLEKYSNQLAVQYGINQDPCLILSSENNPFPRILNFTSKFCSE